MFSKMCGAIVKILICFCLFSGKVAEVDDYSEPCDDLHNIIHLCEDNEVNYVHRLHLSTGKSPLHQHVYCKCTITPSQPLDNYMILVELVAGYSNQSTNFNFTVDNVPDVFNEDIVNLVYSMGETNITYSSPNNTNKLCFFIEVTSWFPKKKISVACFTRTSVNTKQNSTTTGSSILTEAMSKVSTVTSVQYTDDTTNEQTVNMIPVNNKECTMTMWIGIGTSAAISAVVVTVTLVIGCYCCRRRTIERDNNIRMVNVETQPVPEVHTTYERVDRQAQGDQYSELNVPEIPEYIEL
ncbi:hypothetical protein ACF0H5_017903 [Mactra antiquata]